MRTGNSLINLLSMIWPSPILGPHQTMINSQLADTQIYFDATASTYRLHSSSKLSRLKLSAAAHLLSGPNYALRQCIRLWKCILSGWRLPSIAKAFHRHHYGHEEKSGQDTFDCTSTTSCTERKCTGNCETRVFLPRYTYISQLPLPYRQRGA